MKKIFVLRHSKSSWKDLSLGDFHRPLNCRGKTDGPMIASYLCDRIEKIDFLHCSSSVRTYETSKFFIDRIKFIEIKYDESLYHCSSSQIINNIKLSFPKITIILISHRDKSLEICEKVIKFWYNKT